MKYSPENFAIMCAKLRLAGCKIPRMWVTVAGTRGMHMQYVPFTELPPHKVEYHWELFLKEAEYQLARAK